MLKTRVPHWKLKVFVKLTMHFFSFVLQHCLEETENVMGGSWTSENLLLQAKNMFPIFPCRCFNFSTSLSGIGISRELMVLTEKVAKQLKSIGNCSTPKVIENSLDTLNRCKQYLKNCIQPEGIDVDKTTNVSTGKCIWCVIINIINLTYHVIARYCLTYDGVVFSSYWKY